MEEARKDRIRRACADLETFITLTERHNERYITRLSDKDRDAILAAARDHLRLEGTDRDWPEWPSPLRTQAKLRTGSLVFTVTPIREDLDNLRRILSVVEWAETQPALSDWLAARAAMNQAASLMRAAMPAGHPEYLNWSLYF